MRYCLVLSHVFLPYILSRSWIYVVNVAVISRLSENAVSHIPTPICRVRS